MNRYIMHSHENECESIASEENAHCDECQTRGKGPQPTTLNHGGSEKRMESSSCDDFFEQHYWELVRYMSRNFRSLQWQDCEDIAIQAFEKMWSNTKSRSDFSRFAVLKRIAFRLAIDLVRHRSRTKRNGDEVPLDQVDDYLASESEWESNMGAIRDVLTDVTTPVARRVLSKREYCVYRHSCDGLPEFLTACEIVERLTVNERRLFIKDRIAARMTTDAYGDKLRHDVNRSRGSLWEKMQNALPKFRERIAVTEIRKL